MRARSSTGSALGAGAPSMTRGFMSLREAMHPAGTRSARVDRRFSGRAESSGATRWRRPDPGSAGNGRRLASASLCAAVVVALGATGLASAVAATGPSMTVNGNAVNIAIQGPGHSLKFYWATNGTSTWHAETVAGAGSTYSA